MSASGCEDPPLYEDRWITCTPRELTIRGYYFPFGTAKTIALDRIRQVEVVEIGPFSGQLRIWGTSSPRYWAHLDLGRPRKSLAFVLDTGARVRPFITPDRPAALRTVLEQQGVSFGS